MKTRKIKNAVIGILCSLLVFMGIGYAILSQVLTINVGGKISGNWNIYIENITPYSINGEAKSLENKVRIDKLSATIETELNAPKDFVEYKVVVRNDGNINAKLASVTLVPKKTSEYINFTTTAVKDTEIKSESTTEFMVKIEFKDISSFEMPEETINAITELQLNFVQTSTFTTSDSASIEPGHVTNPEAFTVNIDGLLTSYDYSKGTEVKIPAEVNGIPVKSINEYSLLRVSAFSGYAYNESTGDEKYFLSIIDNKNREMIKQALLKSFCENMEIDSDSSDTVLSDCYNSTLEGLGIKVYYSLEEAENELLRYELDVEARYVDNETGEIEQAYTQITKLDLSEATNLETISSFAFEGDVGYASNGECGSQTEGTCGLGKLESIIFPLNGNLKTIGERAFEGNKLTNIIIPSSVDIVKQSAFKNNQITNVIISSGSTIIEESTFQNNQITNLVLPEGMTTINNFSFQNNQITNLVMPSSITKIGNSAFSNNQLTNITIPNGVTNIETSSFSENQLTSVTIPSSITHIGQYAFQNNQLSSIVIPSSVTYIDYAAFANNLFASENDIIIEYDNNNTIGRFNSLWLNIGFPGDGPFDISLCYTVLGSTITGYDEKCGTNITIPPSIKGNNITAIGTDAFFRKALTNVVIPSSITTIGHGAFSSNNITNVTIPASVTTIDSSAFLNNQLTSITIPSSVTSIGNSAFIGNLFTSNNDITIEYNKTSLISRFNSNWNTIGFPGTGPTKAKYGCFYVEPINENIIVDYDKSCGVIVNIPSTINGVTITSIGANSFLNKQLTSVTIPSSVTEINNSAFSNNQLTSVTIPFSVTSIGANSFLNNRLTTLLFEDTKENPSQLKTISFAAFQNNKLSGVTIPSSIVMINSNAFLYNKITSINNVTINYDNVNTIGRFNYSWQSIGFPGIGPFDPNYCFILSNSNIKKLENYCSIPNDLVIPSAIKGTTITGIESLVFQNKGLTSVTIPESIVTIGNGAFQNNSLTNVTIQGDNIYRFNDKWYQIGFDDAIMPHTNKSDSTCYTVYDTTINKYDSTCTKNVVIPSTINDVTITSVNYNAFEGKGLTSVTIPDGVTSIGNYSFSNNQLTSINIPSSVTEINNSAFSNNHLTSVTIQGDDIYRFNDMWYQIGFGDAIMPHTNSLDENCYTISDGQITDYDSKCSTEITIPSSINGTIITGIDSLAFENKGLTSIVFEDTNENPSRIQSIGYKAFNNNHLKSIIIPNSVKTIDEYAFSDNQLMSVTISNGVTSIGNYSFSNNQLTNVTIPDGVTIIGNYSFSNNQLTSIMIPSSVTSIGEAAFLNNHLASVTFEDIEGKTSSLMSIGISAFLNNQLTNVTIPSSVIEIMFNNNDKNYSGAFSNNSIISVTIKGVQNRFNLNWNYIGFRLAPKPTDN